jgi:hypothetical protein
MQDDKENTPQESKFDTIEDALTHLALNGDIDAVAELAKHHQRVKIDKLKKEQFGI